jgi:hypothetical protein
VTDFSLNYSGTSTLFGLSRRVEIFLRAMERTVKYLSEWKSDVQEETLSTFLYNLPYLTACNIFPPLHVLNIFLRKGQAGGSVSPRFTWQPFEISEQEYEEVLPKILNPDWAVLYKTLWRKRLPMKLDPTFDHINDRDAWIEAVAKKHGSKSLEEVEKEIEQFQAEHPDI